MGAVLFSGYTFQKIFHFLNLELDQSNIVRFPDFKNMPHFYIKSYDD